MIEHSAFLNAGVFVFRQTGGLLKPPRYQGVAGLLAQDELTRRSKGGFAQRSRDPESPSLAGKISPGGRVVIATIDESECSGYEHEIQDRWRRPRGAARIGPGR
jgi:hypothetical protein